MNRSSKERHDSRLTAAHPGEEHAYHDEMPSVDDLEIAAAAAEALPLHQSSAINTSHYKTVPSWRSSATTLEDDSCESSSDEDSDSDIPMGEAAEMPPVAVRLTAQPGDRPVLVSMEVRQGACSNEGGSADCMISQLEKMVAVVSDDEDAVATGIDDQVLPALPEEAMDISSTDTLLAAGRVISVVEGILVVQARELMRALDVGSVLCSESRTPYGRIEDIFGPVSRPLYALRSNVSDAIVNGATVYAPAALAVFVDTQSAWQQEAAVAVAASGNGEDDIEFSDDESEANWQRQMNKRGSSTPLDRPLPSKAASRARRTRAYTSPSGPAPSLQPQPHPQPQHLQWQQQHHHHQQQQQTQQGPVVAAPSWQPAAMYHPHQVLHGGQLPPPLGWQSTGFVVPPEMQLVPADSWSQTLAPPPPGPQHCWQHQQQFPRGAGPGYQG